MLRGYALAYPALICISYDPLYVIRETYTARGKVALLAGGGSGHEPMHLGFVGYGMLDAAVPGPIFTAPTPDQIIAATIAADRGAGVLYIIKNYAGDILNFEIAREVCAARGIAIASVLVNDDAALDAAADRRGIGATVLVEKIAGAAAESGASLAECAAIAQRVVDATRSIGVALTSCTVPERGRPTFDLGDDEIEIGVGIHGERGRRRGRYMSAAPLVRELAELLLDRLDTRAGDRTLAFVNGLGATPPHELHIVYAELVGRCADAGVSIVRNLIGSYLTSLDMAGCSITLLRLDDDLCSLWDAPVHTAALRWGM